jgi:hypothetical protein
MKRIIPKQSKPKFYNSIESLHLKTQKWISEIEFIKVEQQFLKEMLAEHVLEFCSTDNYAKAKLLLHGIEHETKLGIDLLNDVKEHKINLALLIENIYLKKEDAFRQTHELLKNEVKNYIENFKCIKEQVFDLILFIMKKEKQKKLLTN